MIVPSGYGSFPSRYALIATSLPRIAAKLCSVPSSWATDTNLQSRYPGGILIPKIGTASPPPCPDAGAVNTKIPPPVATAISKKAIHFIAISFSRCLLAPHYPPPSVIARYGLPLFDALSPKPHGSVAARRVERREVKVS